MLLQALFRFGFLSAQSAGTTAYLSAIPDAVVGASAGIGRIGTTPARAGSALAGGTTRPPRPRATD